MIRTIFKNLVVLAAVLAAIAIVAVWIDLKRECEARGGALVQGASGPVCVEVRR